MCKQNQFTDKTTHRQQANHSVKSMSHIIWHINPQIQFVDIQLGSWNADHCFQPLWPWSQESALEKCTHSRSLLSLMVAVPYLVCRYILGPGESPTGSRSLWPWLLVSVLKRSSPEHNCIWFEVGISNLVWGYILGSWHVSYTSGPLWHAACT